MKLMKAAALPLLALVGMTACKDPRVDDLTVKVEKMRTKIIVEINNDRTWEWKAHPAICQLEALAKAKGWAIDDTKKLCKGGSDDGPPPPLPPKWPED